MGLERRLAKLQSILDVARALTVERDLDALLTLIVEHAKDVVEADRVTLFVHDRSTRELWSRIAHGLTVQEIRLARGTGIAGYVADHDEVLNIPDPYADPRFNKDVDLQTGYRTEAILCVPMRGPRGEVVGVLQALNPIAKDEPFDGEDEELLLALGGQAAAALQNAFLYDSIERVFEGLVRASVVAIESRDPATSGHSERVSALTLGLAKAVHDRDDGPFAGVRFSAPELRELRYACLLHDMGKVGVREAVLTKAEKLYPRHLDRIRERFATARASLERDHWRQVAELYRSAAESASGTAAVAAEVRRLDAVLAEELAELMQTEHFVRRASRPAPLSPDDRELLDSIARAEMPAESGRRRTVLEPEEAALLTIPRGTLSAAERLEIESHVSHSYRFLMQIPWTDDLARVPEIAWGHHEKLDGTGYPRGVEADRIPLETRMMTIADIYDALTASDRPYKKAMSHDRAIAILGVESERGAICPDLLAVFVDAEVPQRVLGLLGSSASL